MRPGAKLPTTLSALFPYFPSCRGGGEPPVGGPGPPNTSSCCLRLGNSTPPCGSIHWRNCSEASMYVGESQDDSKSAKENQDSHIVVFQPFFHGGAPTVIFHIPMNPCIRKFTGQQRLTEGSAINAKLLSRKSISKEMPCKSIYIVLTYLLTPWSRVLLEKLTGSAASQEIPRIFGTRRFITLRTNARHLSLSWANSIQSPQPPPTSWRSILILSSHLCLGLPNGLFPSGSPTRTLCTPLFILYEKKWSIFFFPPVFWGTLGVLSRYFKISKFLRNNSPTPPPPSGAHNAFYGTLVGKQSCEVLTCRHTHLINVRFKSMYCAR